MKYPLLIMFCIFAFGCASTPDLRPPVYVALESEVTPAIDGKLDKRKSIFLELGVIPGALYGSPVGDPLIYIDMHTQSSPSLDIANFELVLGEYAEQWTGHASNGALTMTPVKTKLVRLSTFGVDLEDEKFLSGGLRDKSGNFVVLTYFDRACSISGTIDFGDGVLNEHNIKIENPGLYRLVLRESNGRKIVTAEQGLEPIVVVLE